MEDTIKGLLIKRKENTNKLIFSNVEIDRKNALETYYKMLDCETIDIQERYINNKIYDFIIDDEYLINGKADKEQEIIAIGTRKGEILELIYHALLIVGIANNKGEETDLTNNDIDNILIKGLGQATSRKTDNKYQIIGYTFEKEF